jgi:hypothetical protein
VTLTPDLQAPASDAVAFTASYLDLNGVIPASELCTARRTIIRGGGATLSSGPWDAAVKTVSPTYSGTVTVGNIPRNATMVVRLVIDCPSANGGQRGIIVNIKGFDDGTTAAADFDLAATNLPTVAYDAPAGQLRQSTIAWLKTGPLDDCTIRELRADGAYGGKPGSGKIPTWGTWSNINANDSVLVSFAYPDAPSSTYRYAFRMRCSAPASVAGIQRDITLTATREADPGGGGSGTYSLAVTDPTPVSYANPATTGSAGISWSITGDVGTCTITAGTSNGSFSPPVSAWGSGITASNGVALTVAYPPVNTAGEVTYPFTMQCSKVTEGQTKTITATRTNGAGGVGSGEVLNFGYGSRRF